MGTTFANASKLTKEKVQGLKQETTGWWSKGQGLVDGLNLFPNIGVAGEGGSGTGVDGAPAGEVIAPGLSRTNSRSNSMDSAMSETGDAGSGEERNSGVGDAVADRAERAAAAAQSHADEATAALAAELGRSASAVRKGSKAGVPSEGGEVDASTDGEEDQVEL